MNLTYLKIGVPLALIGGILGLIAFFSMLLIPPNFFASLMVNMSFVLLGYLSLAASVIIVALVLALSVKKLLKYLKTILILAIILGILEVLGFSFTVSGSLYPQLFGIIGGALAVIGGILAWVGLMPEKAKPAKKAK